MQRNTHIGTRRPPGFTLVEMLVVISIIIALIALTVTAIGNIVDNANRAATRVTIDKAHKLLQQQLDAWARDFRGSDEVKDRAPKFSGLVAHPRGQEALALKAFYRLNYPQNAAEAKAGFDGIVGTADDGLVFPKWHDANNPSIADSSELLYLALTTGKVRASTPVDADTFSGNELADTDNDGFMELVDAWGNPLRFYRWPTRLLHPFGFVGTTLTNGVEKDDTTLDVENGSGFQSVLGFLGNGADVRLVVGREVMQLQAADGSQLTVIRTGDREKHPAQAVVQLAAFPEIVSTVFGSLNSSTLAHDADDPRGDIVSSLRVSPDQFESLFHTLDSYHTPLIVSAGSDGVLGLYEPADTDNLGHFAAPQIPQTANGPDYSIIGNPLSSTLNDNLTNQMEGLGN